MFMGMKILHLGGGGGVAINLVLAFFLKKKIPFSLVLRTFIVIQVHGCY